MSQIIKKITDIMNKSESHKIVLFTNHLKIVGTVHECEECNNDYYINLTNVTVIDISTLYPCEEDGNCDDFISQNFDWLHVNAEKILAFSFIKRL